MSNCTNLSKQEYKHHLRVVEMFAKKSAKLTVVGMSSQKRRSEHFCSLNPFTLDQTDAKVTNSGKQRIL